MNFVNMRKAVITVLALVSTVLIICSFAYYKTINIAIAQKQQHNIIAEQRVYKSYYSQLKFSISLLNQLNKDEPRKNIFFSPHSVYSTLLFAYFGVAGETEKELKQILELDWAESKADVQNVYKLKKEKQDRFQNQSIIEFTSINKLYVSKCINVRYVSKLFFFLINHTI